MLIPCRGGMHILICPLCNPGQLIKHGLGNLIYHCLITMLMALVIGICPVVQQNLCQLVQHALVSMGVLLTAHISKFCSLLIRIIIAGELFSGNLINLPSQGGHDSGCKIGVIAQGVRNLPEGIQCIRRRTD